MTEQEEKAATAAPTTSTPMTPLDCFAAVALHALLALGKEAHPKLAEQHEDSPLQPADYAKAAYSYADAMMKEKAAQVAKARDDWKALYT